MAVRLIASLGNPGTRYAATRHNVGVMALERVATRWAVTLSKIGSTRQGRGRVGSVEVLLAEPLAWMNGNGPVVKDLLEECGLSSHDLIVLHDDVDLAVGRLRIKRDGGSGGHKGILSILTALETNQFCRLKIGVGRPAPGEETADYVLSQFTPDEFTIIMTTLDRAVLALESLILDGVDAAMNRFHMQDQGAQE